MTAKDLIIAALVDLYQNGPRDSSLGICTYIGDFVEEETKDLGQADEVRVFWAVRDLRDDLFCLWPLRSGDLDYPVPDPEGWAPSTAFYACDDLWVGEYGAKRWALAEFMLRTLANGAT